MRVLLWSTYITHVTISQHWLVVAHRTWPVSHPSTLPKLLHMSTLPLCFCHLTSSFLPVTIATTTRGSRHWAGLHFDLLLLENDPSLRCCSDSFFCAVSLANDAPPHVFKPSCSVLMSMLILDVFPPPSLAHDWIHLLHSIYCFLSDIPCTLIGVAPVLCPPIQRRQFGGLEMTNVWPALQSGRLMSSACQLATVPLVVMPDCCVN